MGLLPMAMTPTLCPDGLCWDSAAFRRYKKTSQKLFLADVSLQQFANDANAVFLVYSTPLRGSQKQWRLSHVQILIQYK